MDRSESATRRRSSAASTGKFSLYAPAGPPSPPPIDMELPSIGSPSPQAYTSLRDVLPGAGAVGSPHGGARTPPGGACEISIRNRLVKQAAWAYLQPMSAASPSYSGADYFHRLRGQFSGGGDPVAACLGFFRRRVAAAVNWLLRAIGFSRFNR